MQLEQFVEQLEGTEQVEYQALVEESQNGGDDKAIRGCLARLAMEVLKRLGEKPNHYILTLAGKYSIFTTDVGIPFQSDTTSIYLSGKVLRFRGLS